MKKFTTTVFAVMLTATFAPAQTIKNDQIKYLSKQINVSDSLASIVESIMATYKVSVSKIMESKNLNPDEMRIKIDALIEERKFKLKKILTEEQLDKLLPTTEKKKD